MSENNPAAGLAATSQVRALAVRLTDVRLGSDGTTVSFAIDDADYEIDLSVANASALHEALAPYVKAGRKLGRTAAAAPAVSRVRKSTNLNAIREWARAHGHTVSDRGRIAGSIVEAYKLANA